MRKLLALPLVVALSACAASAPRTPASGPDGIEFNTVHLDTRVDCDSLILRGTRRYSGSVFILPRILISVNKEGDTLFEVIPDGQGGYEFDFALYVPRTDYDLEFRRSNPLFQHGCNIDAVMESLNRGVQARDKVDRPVRVPIKSIDIQVEGMDGNYTIGSGDTTLLNYQGLDHKVSFKIPGRPALETFLRRLTGNIGIRITAKVRFNARTSDGYVSADVDMTAVERSLATKLRGRATVAAGELSAAVRDSLTSSNVKIYAESGTSDTYAKVSQMIFEMIAKQLASMQVTPPSNGPAPTAPEPGTDTPFAVSAVLSYLRDAHTQHVEYSGLGENREEVYETSSILQAQAGDPADNEVTLKSTGPGYVYPASITAGQSIALAPMEDAEESLAWNERVHYLTTSQLRDMHFASYFPAISDTSYSVVDMNMPAVGVVARTQPSHWWNGFSSEYYLWGMSDLEFSVKGRKPVSHDWTEADLAKWPMRVRFSKVGGRLFTLQDLVTDNAYWKGEFDSTAGKVVINAKKDLGNAQVSLVHTPYVFNRVNHYLFQERRNSAQQNLGREQKEEKRSDLPDTRRVFKLRIGSTDAASAPPSLVPSVTPAGQGIGVPAR